MLEESKPPVKCQTNMFNSSCSYIYFCVSCSLSSPATDWQTCPGCTLPFTCDSMDRLQPHRQPELNKKMDGWMLSVFLDQIQSSLKRNLRSCKRVRLHTCFRSSIEEGTPVQSSKILRPDFEFCKQYLQSL